MFGFDNDRIDDNQHPPCFLLGGEGNGHYGNSPPLVYEYSMGRRGRIKGQIFSDTFGGVDKTLKGRVVYSPGQSQSFDWIFDISYVVVATVEDVSVCLFSEADMPQDTFMLSFYAQIEKNDSWLFYRPWDLYMYDCDPKYVLDGKTFTLGESFSYCASLGYDLTYLGLGIKYRPKVLHYYGYLYADDFFEYGDRGRVHRPFPPMPFITTLG